MVALAAARGAARRDRHPADARSGSECALLGLSTLKLALHKAKGTPLPGGVGRGSGDLDLK